VCTRARKFKSRASLGQLITTMQDSICKTLSLSRTGHSVDELALSYLPTLGQHSGPALVHQLHDACSTLRLSRVQLLQGLFPLGDGITDLKEAKEES
jgi:hypothetical protein